MHYAYEMANDPLLKNIKGDLDEVHETPRYKEFNYLFDGRFDGLIS